MGGSCPWERSRVPVPMGGLGTPGRRGGGVAKGGDLEKPGAPASGPVGVMVEPGQREEPSSRLGTPRHSAGGS